MFVVTGGGRGIGSALAVALAQRGKPVLIIGRDEASLIKTAAYSPLIQSLCADVAVQDGRKTIQERLQSVAAIHGLIHNAGIIDPIAPIESIDEAAWHACMATNIEAPLFLTQLLVDKLGSVDHPSSEVRRPAGRRNPNHQQPLGAGRVLNISSGAAHFPVAGWAAYCVSKAALSMLTRCWQKESTGIAFASVMPGIIDTQMQSRIRAASHMNPDKLDFFKRLKQEQRLLTPETVAEFLCWLLLDIDSETYSSREWDIYDTSHHAAWLVPPNIVHALE